MKHALAMLFLTLVVSVLSAGQPEAQTRNYKDDTFNGTKPDRQGKTIIFAWVQTTAAKRNTETGAAKAIAPTET